MFVQDQTLKPSSTHTHPLAAVLLAAVLAALVPQVSAVACFQCGFPEDPGPNRGGTLILASTGIETSTARTYCREIELDACDAAVTRHDGETVIVVSVLAAFNEMTSPVLAGVSFGWEYDESELTFVRRGICGAYELATPDWPGSGEGTSVVFNPPRQSHLVEVYWVAMYSTYGNPASLRLIPHPIHESCFADDTIPSVLDCVAGFGSFGFNMDGANDCPANVLLGKCCFGGDLCEVMLEDECRDAGGNFGGWGSECEDGCTQAGPGSCCLNSGECIIVPSELACDRHEGSYNHQVGCNPNPCQPIPTIENSWGEIKARHSGSIAQ